MQKHDKMVALAKEKSAEMTETAITAIETMYSCLLYTSDAADE